MGDTVRATEIYRVAPGYESDFYSWGNEVFQELARSSRFLGGRVLEPDHEGGDWELEHRWADPDVAARWLESAERAELLAAAADFARLRRTRQGALAPVVVTWSAPKPVRYNSAPEPEPAPEPPMPPPQWKTAVVTLLAVLPPVLLLDVTLIPRLGVVNVVIRALLVSVGVAAAMTWVMMPLFKGWLNSGQGVGRDVPRATIDRRVYGDAELLARRPAALGIAPVDTAPLPSADSYSDPWDPYRDQYRSRAGRDGYLHQPSQNRRDPR